MAERPLSPHLQVYKWGPHMTLSILHRVSGNGLAVVGLGVLLWWLGAMASGAEAYDLFAGLAGAWYGKVVLIGLTWAFFNHMCSGLRHFVLDVGAGYELDTNRMFSWVSMIAGVVLTAALWAYILLL